MHVCVCTRTCVCVCVCVFVCDLVLGDLTSPTTNWTCAITVKQEGMHRCPDSVLPHGLWPSGLFCPWDFPGKNTGVGCRFLLQWFFPTQEMDPSLWPLLHLQADSLPPESLLKPCMSCSNYHFHSQTEAIAILKYVYNFALILHIAFAEKKKITLLVYVVFCMLWHLHKLDVYIYSSATCFPGSEIHL